MHSFVDLLKYGLEYCGLFYGTYRAQVKDNVDPQGRGRIQIFCPQVHGTSFPQVWAEHKSAMAGKGFGFWHVPDVGEWVYVQFDHGRSEFPIWDGGWWGTGDTTEDMIVSKVVLTTKEGLKLVFDRDGSTILIQHSEQTYVFLEAGRATIQAPQLILESDDIELKGPTKITGAVTVIGDGNVVGDWTVSGENSGHHTHPIGPDPLAPLTTIALPNPL